jgi:hypothetical protein
MLASWRAEAYRPGLPAHGAPATHEIIFFGPGDVNQVFTFTFAPTEVCPVSKGEVFLRTTKISLENREQRDMIPAVT